MLASTAKKILFLPLLKMSSGHHRVADALSTAIKQLDSTIICKKVDIITETSPALERLVTSTYLKWINASPKTYKTIYRYFADPKADQASSSQMALIRYLFKNRLLEIIEEEKPDILVCTHGFPSSILNELKKKKKITTPVVNVYTDFFINHIWGKEYIDYHLVADHELRQYLYRHYPLRGMVFVSGIPVDPVFQQKITKHKLFNSSLQVLVAGGSNGLFDIKPFLHHSDSYDITYKILCGTNEHLYEKLKKAQYPHIEPLPYIENRMDMNILYENCDALITKPGGVTISEALNKHLPIFINHVLPGQEEYNLDFLKEKKLIFSLSNDKPYAEQIDYALNQPQKRKEQLAAMQKYQTSITINPSIFLYKLLYADQYLKQERSVY